MIISTNEPTSVMSVSDIAFGELISWLKRNNLEAHTSRGQTLIVRRKMPRRKLMVKNGRIIAKC